MNEMTKVRAEDHQATQARMLEAIKLIKSDTKRFDELKARLKGKSTDAERADILIDFIVDNEDLTTAVPTNENGEPLAWVTITVTTVLIFASSAY